MKTTNYFDLAKASGLTDRRIAAKAGCSHATVRRILTGKGIGFQSKELEAKVHGIVEEEGKRALANLERLMGSPNAEQG